MPKSRYGSVSLYISDNPNFQEKYNDVPVHTNAWVFDKLTKAGFDKSLATHFAHLFIQDPLVVYQGKVQMDDTTHADHFENIQSTNWQTVRFKPPPPNSGIGWRVEFRSMELMLHDFENAAFVVFIALLTRVLSQFRLNLYMPISAVDINMERAHERDAVLSERFYWRKHAVTSATGEQTDDSMVQISANEIINGGSTFIGLIPLIERYLDTTQVSAEDRANLAPYLKLVGDRAAGRIMTGARWQREFVLRHPEYKHDSVVSESIAYDLLQAMAKLEAETDHDQVLCAYTRSATPLSGQCGKC